MKAIARFACFALLGFAATPCLAQFDAKHPRECVASIDPFSGATPSWRSADDVRRYADSPSTRRTVCARIWAKEAANLERLQSACVIRSKERDRYGNFVYTDERNNRQLIADCASTLTGEDLIANNHRLRTALEKVEVAEQQAKQRSLNEQQARFAAKEQLEREIAAHPERFEKIEFKYIAQGTPRCGIAYEQQIPQFVDGELPPTGCHRQDRPVKITSIFNKSKFPGWVSVGTTDNALAFVREDGLKTLIEYTRKSEAGSGAASPSVEYCASLADKCAAKDSTQRAMCFAAMRQVGCR